MSTRRKRGEKIGLKRKKAAWNRVCKYSILPDGTKDYTTPQNLLPLGSIVKYKRGGVDRIKIKHFSEYSNDYQGRYFKSLATYWWEKHYGVKLKKGYKVWFIDGNRNNFKPNNLFAVSYHLGLWLNKAGMKEFPNELKKSILLTGLLEEKVYKLIRRAKNTT